MRTITIKKQLELDATEAFTQLSDFSLFEKNCDAVIEVKVQHTDNHKTLSDWSVHFHDGQMHWQEEDVFDRENLTIRFTQTQGDAEEFKGHWSVKALSDNLCEIEFTAEFCMGIPSLADILEPIAEEAIRHNIEQMLEQLFVAEAA